MKNRLVWNEFKASVPLTEGMFISLEIGYFEDDSFGILLANTVMIKKKMTKFGHNNFLTFEVVSMFPFKINLIERLMLQKTHIDGPNAYHKKVQEMIGQELTEDELDERNWLQFKTRSIGENTYDICKEITDDTFENKIMNKSTHLFISNIYFNFNSFRFLYLL